MPAASVQTLLTRTKEADAQREADAAARYGKLVRRAAAGEELVPETVLQTLAALGVDAPTFADDVEYTAHRIELRAVADQLAARKAAADRARHQVEAAAAAYTAAVEKLQREYQVVDAAARQALRSAETAHDEAQAAERALLDGCRDTELQDRLAAIERGRSDIRTRAARHREAVFAADRTLTHIETEAATEERQRAVLPEWKRDTHFDPTKGDAKRTARREAAGVAIEVHAPQLDALTARDAELAAEAAALEPRLLEPWPVGASLS